jgi:hypothetical protein
MSNVKKALKKPKLDAPWLEYLPVDVRRNLQSSLYDLERNEFPTHWSVSNNLNALYITEQGCFNFTPSYDFHFHSDEVQFGTGRLGLPDVDNSNIFDILEKHLDVEPHRSQNSVSFVRQYEYDLGRARNLNVSISGTYFRDGSLVIHQIRRVEKRIWSVDGFVSAMETRHIVAAATDYEDSKVVTFKRIQ